MGTRDGSIIATIITTHIPRNEAAAPIQLCPGIRIQAIDISQPPGIGIPRCSDIDPHHAIVPAVLATKSSAETPRKARRGARSAGLSRDISGLAAAFRPGRRRRTPAVFVVTPPPDARLVSSQRCAVEPLV